MTTPKNMTIDVVKGIGILLVVYGHIIQRTVLPQGGDFFLNPVFKIIYTFHMPLFVGISGYLLAGSLGRRRIPEVFYSRVRGLLVPYLAWGAVGLGVALILGSAAGPLLSEPSAWFLFVLFSLSAILLAVLQWGGRFRMVMIVGIYFLLLMVPGNEHFDLYYIQWFYPFLMAGYFFAQWGRAPDIRRHFLPVTAVALILFVSLAARWGRNDYIYVNRMQFAPGDLINEAGRLVYRYAAAFTGIVLVFGIGHYLRGTKAGGALAWIGVYSLDIYLLQRFIVEGAYGKIAGVIPVRWDTNGAFFLGVMAPLVTAFLTAVCIGVSVGIFRRQALLNRFFLGGR